MWNCTSLPTTSQGKNCNTSSTNSPDDGSATTLGENDDDEGSLDLLAPRRIKKAKRSTAENSSPTTTKTTKKLYSPASQTLNMLNAFNTTSVDDLFVSNKELLKTLSDRKQQTNDLTKQQAPETTTTSHNNKTTTTSSTTIPGSTETVVVENLSTFFRNSSNVKAGMHVGCQRCLELATKGSSNVSHGIQCPSRRSSQQLQITQDTTTTQYERNIMDDEPPTAILTQGASSSSLEDHSLDDDDDDEPTRRDIIPIGTNLIKKGPVVDPFLSHSCSQQLQNPVGRRSEISATTKEPRTTYYSQQGSHDSRVLLPRERLPLPSYQNEYMPRMVAPIPGDTIYHDKEEDSRWVSCGNPWGPHGYLEGDVVVAFAYEEEEVIHSYYYHPPRFCHDPFSISSTYRKTHCGGLDNYTVLSLRRDAFALQFWGFTTSIHEFGGACLVQHITPCSPADAAVDVGNSHIDENHPFVGGLRVNDMILCINGKAVGGMSELEFLTEMDLCGPTMLLVVARCFDTNIQMSSARSTREVDASYWAFNEPLHWTEFGGNTIPQSNNLDESYTHWDNNGRRQHHPDTNNGGKLSSIQPRRASGIDRAKKVKDSRVDKRVVANSKGGFWPKQYVDKENSNKECNRLSLDVNQRFVDHHPENPGTEKAIHRVNTQEISHAKKRERSQAETIHEIKSSTTLSTAIRSKATESNTQVTQRKHGTSEVESKNAASYQDYVKRLTATEIESRRQLAKDWGLPENWLAYRRNNNYSICNPEGVRFLSKKAALDSLNQMPLKKRLLPTECEPDEESITICSGVSIQKAEPMTLSCTCGKTHPETKSVFWIQCDKCDIWYNVSPRCVGFDHDQAIHLDSWFCLECGRNSSVQPRSDNSLNGENSHNSSVVGSQNGTPLDQRVVANSKGGFWPRQYVDKENSNKECNIVQPSISRSSCARNATTTEEAWRFVEQACSVPPVTATYTFSTTVSTAIRSKATEPNTQVIQRKHGTSEVENQNAASYQDYVRGLTAKEIESRRQFAKDLGLPENWLAYRNHVYNYFICNPEGVRFSSKKVALDSLNQMPLKKRLLPTECEPGEESITICSGVSIENSQNSSVVGSQHSTPEKNKRTFNVGELVIVTYNLTGEVGRVTHVYMDPENGGMYYDIAYLLGRTEKNVEAEWLTPHESSFYDCSRTRGRSRKS